MFAASASMMSFAAPLTGLYGGRAFAQALPAGCVDSNPSDPGNSNVGNNQIDNDETIECVSNPAGTPIGTITAAADDLTFNIGDGSTDTLVQFNGSGSAALDVMSNAGITINVLENAGIVSSSTQAVSAFLTGPGNLSLNMAPNSEVSSTGGNGVFALLVNPNGHFELDGNSGQISGSVYGVQTTTLGGNIIIEDLSAVSAGSLSGIRASASDSGTIIIQDIGSVTSQSYDAIDSVSDEGSISIQNIVIPEFDHDDDPGTPNISSAGGISAATLTGNINIGAEDPANGTGIGGIFAQGIGISTSAYGGDIRIHTDGAINAGGKGIYVKNGGAGLTNITAIGAINAGTYGIEVKQSAGAVAITATDIYSQNNYAVSVDAGATATGVDVTTTGTVFGSITGIDVQHDGSGAVAIAANNVEGQGYAGIRARTESASTTLDVTASGQVRGGSYGIDLVHNGLGNATIDLASNAVISSRFRNGLMLNTRATGSAAIVNGNSGRISGGATGAFIVSNGGDILAENLTSVIGGTYPGLYTKSYGGGITIRNIGNVGTETYDAIYATSDQGEISIQNVAVTPFDHDNDTGTADFTSPAGIKAVSTSGNINIGAEDPANGTGIGDISAQGNGIYAQTTGGEVRVRTEGVINTGAKGVYVKNDGTGLTYIAASGGIAAADDGIEVKQTGGPVTIVAADVSSTNQKGIDAIGAAGVTDLSITTTGTVSGDRDGISGSLSGTGALYINANNVTSSTRDGINAFTSSTATQSTVIATGDVTADDTGINALHQGVGSLSVTANNVSATNSYGIYASTASISDALNITTNGNIFGNTQGIMAIHRGTGAATVTLGANGDIASQTADGVRMRSETDGASSTLKGSSGLITGATFGAELRTNNGDIIVENLTSVTGGTDVAIEARSTGGAITIQNITNVGSENATALNIDTRLANLSGGNDISIQNIGVTKFDHDDDPGTEAIASMDGMSIASGDGNINIGFGDLNDPSDDDASAIGDVETQGRGIAASAGYGSVRVNVAGNIQVEEEAIDVESVTGELEVQLHGDIYSSRYDTSFTNGVVQANSLNGEVSITSVGSIAAPNAEAAIVASNVFGYDIVRVEVNDVRGKGYAIYAATLTSSGDVSIYVNGLTESYSNIAIGTRTRYGATVQVNESGTIEAPVDAIHFNPTIVDASDDVFTLFGRVGSGNVRMNFGDDTFNYGGTLADGVTVFGGDGTDTLNFVSTFERTFTDTVDPDGQIQEFEILGFSGDNITLAGTHSGWEAVNFNLGTTFLDGVLETPIATIQPGGTLHGRDGARLVGDLANSGTLLIGDSPGVFTVAGNFLQTGGGLLPIEISGTDHDRLVVEGSANLDGELHFLADLTDLPADVQSFTVLTSDLGITGAFSAITDTLPDLNFGLLTTATDPNAVMVTYIAPEMADPMDPSDPSDSGDAGDDGDTGDDSDTGGDSGESPTPEPEPEPLLSAKEIVPSGLSAAMRVNDLFVETLIQRRAVQMQPDQWSFWSNAFGGQHDVGMKNAVPGWDGDTSGLSLGVERLMRVDGNPVLFGVSGGYSESSITSDVSHGDVESYHLGGFANADLGSLFVAGSLAYSWQDYGFERAIVGPSSATLAYGETEGTGWALKAEAVYDLLGDDAISLGPVATFGSTIAEYDGFKETGAGILNLNWTDESAYQTVLGLGGEGGFETELSGLTLDTGLRVLYEKVGGDRGLQTRAFLDVAGAQFRPRAATLDTERAAISFDTKLYLTEGFFAHIRYDTTRGDNLVDHEGWAGITLRF